MLFAAQQRSPSFPPFPPQPQPCLQVTLRHFFEFASFLCEMFVFAYLGLQVATMQHAFDFGLFFSGIPLAVLSRAANILLCSRLINTWRSHKLPVNLQKMLLAVGLRGAVAYGLGGWLAAGGWAVCRLTVHRRSHLLWPLSSPSPPACLLPAMALPAACLPAVINLPRSDQPGQTGVPAIETATLLIVVVTTLGLGSATGPLLRHFELEGKDDAALLGLDWTEDLRQAAGMCCSGPWGLCCGVLLPHLACLPSYSRLLLLIARLPCLSLPCLLCAAMAWRQALLPPG